MQDKINKQETLEEADTNYTIDFTTMSAFKLGAKWQQEQDKKMYSEEEVLEFANYFGTATKENLKWFEKFKNK
jgi:hypothetical protein